MKKTAEQLVRSHPGAFEHRKEIILALCRGVNLGVFADSDLRRGDIGHMIVATANRIIEETLQ